MLSTSRTPRLPPELIDRVIDHLHPSPSDLHVCALVCKAWLTSCRFHIFRRIEVYPSRRPKRTFPRLSKLYQAIQDSPNIAFCVQELFFSVGFEGRVQMNPEEWPHLETVLPQLLDSFTALKAFGLEGICWAELTPPIRKAFRAVFALPSITDIRTSAMQFGKLEHVTDLIHTPLKILTADIHFVECCAEDIRAVDRENEQLRFPERRLCQLEYLGLDMDDSSPEFVDWLLGERSTVDLSATHTFEAWCFLKAAANSMARVMTRLGPSLRHLILRYPQIEDWNGSIEDTVDLSCNLDIQTLTVWTGIHPDVPCYLATCLSRFPGKKLRVVDIKLWGEFRLWDKIGSLWSELDDILSSQSFETLQELTLHLWPWSSISKDDYQKFLDQFPSLAPKGILRLICPIS